MNTVNMIRKILNKILSAVVIFLMAFMTVLVTYQVVMRYVFVHPVTWSEDTLTYSFVWMSLIGTAVVFGERDHMMLTLFSDKLEGIPKQILCMVLVYVLMVKGGMSVFNIGKGQVSPTLGIRMSNVYTILPVSGVFILIYNVLNIIDSVAAIVNNKKGGAA